MSAGRVFFHGTVDVDFIGFALFDPVLLERRHGGIAPGTDLWTRWTTTDEGDAVIAEGLVVPVLGLTDAGYELIVRDADAPLALPEILFENGAYPLRVEHRLVVADCGTFAAWGGDFGWQEIAAPPGAYGVTVRGFRALDAAGRSIERAGYDLALARGPALPPMGADMTMSMQVLRLPGA